MTALDLLCMSFPKCAHPIIFIVLPISISLSTYVYIYIRVSLSLYIYICVQERVEEMLCVAEVQGFFEVKHWWPEGSQLTFGPFRAKSSLCM